MADQSFTAAVVQAASVCFDQQASLDKLACLAREASANGARLAVFPEAFVSGYPSSLDWGGASAAIREDVAASDYERYWRSSIELGPEGMPRLNAIATENALNLVVGVIEREQGSIYCTAVMIDENGRYLGKHRKIMPTVAERLVWARGDGSTLSAVDTPLGRMGAVICWENYMPLLRMHMYQQGVEIYCAPTADDQPGWTASMQHIAMEGRCFVLSANQFTQRKDFPDDYGNFPSDDPDAIISHGGSCIIDPMGRILAGPDHAQETILYAQIDLSLTIRGKFYSDVCGHYSRPDLFSMRSNTQYQQNVQIESRETPASESDAGLGSDCGSGSGSGSGKNS